MFERFTEGARQAVVRAQAEAQVLRHNYIGTEHLLLGLLGDEEGVAGRVLADLGLDVEGVRTQVGRIVGRGREVAVGHVPFTPRAKKVLELALRDALSLGHDYIGTEHLLLGIARENEGVASRILLDSGVDRVRVRDVVRAALADPEYKRQRPTSSPAVVRRRKLPRPHAAAPAPTPPSFAQALARALERAARAANGRAIDTGDLLVALLEEPHGVIAAALAQEDVDVDALRAAIAAARERGA